MKKVIPIEKLLNSLNTKELYENKYARIISEARGSKGEQETAEKLKVKTGYYSMRTRVKNNPWIDNTPASKAIKWLFGEVFKNSSKYKYNKLLMYQGGMFIFEYFNPKYKGTSVLPWFDKYPLVISLGPKVTKLGIRNIGFNLHLLPPKIRIIVMCAIFELFKKLYRHQIFFKTQNPVQIDYKLIVKNLERYGVKFCVRMYIPQRMKQIVCFPYTDWHKSIFIPSRGYDSIRAQKLIQEWKNFCKKNGQTISPNVNWKAII